MTDVPPGLEEMEDLQENPLRKKAPKPTTPLTATVPDTEQVGEETTPTLPPKPLAPKPKPAETNPLAPKSASKPETSNTKKGSSPVNPTTTTSTTQAPAPLPPQAAHQNHKYWGVAWIILGIGCLYIWLLSNAIQLQTTMAWFTQDHGSLILSFNLADYKAILPTQHMSQRLMIACIFAWFQQLIQDAFAIGLDLQQLMGKKKAGWYVWFSIFYIVMNSLADLNFGGMYSDWWQPWVFAGACFMVSFYFGLGAIGLIIKGFRILMA